MDYYGEVWGFQLIECGASDTVTTKEVKRWRFLQGLDCSPERIQETRDEIREALESQFDGEVTSVPGVIVDFGEYQTDRFLQYNLMKEEFCLGYTGYASSEPDRLGDLYEVMEYFLAQLQEDG